LPLLHLPQLQYCEYHKAPLSDRFEPDAQKHVQERVIGDVVTL
jgi:hypothetical protein